ncbi:MAG: putative deacetylase [Candidatus Saccharibacteria bacterium]|nr:putative deacetylase [Candidatus Saccharibacteria bacterium]
MCYHISMNFAELQPKVVLGIAAHPDDLDFGASGTMARYAGEGASVYYLIVTDGSKGTDDRSLTPAQLIQIRQNEQRAAVQAVGGKDVFFLGYPDGGLEVTMDLKRDIVRVIRQVKPDVVITMDPSLLYVAERGFINHPDHRAASQAALDSVFPLARDHLSFPDLFAQGFEPHKTPTVLLIRLDGNANFSVDITSTIEVKKAALAAHASQIADIEKTFGWVKQLAAEAGGKAGSAYAESFMRIDVN